MLFALRPRLEEVMEIGYTESESVSIVCVDNSRPRSRSIARRMLTILEVIESAICAYSVSRCGRHWYSR